MSAFTHPHRYPGTRWRLVIGSYDGIEQFAADELQRTVQLFQPYVLPVNLAAEAPYAADDHLILVGSAANNPLIAELVKRKLVAIPDQPEGYAVACLPSPWKADRKCLVVAGRDASGVLYGVEDFCASVLGRHTAPRQGLPQIVPEVSARMRESFDNMPEFSLADYPRIQRRGLWTWGYVIYDYQRYLDNMARLRMNTLIVWNDEPPLNSRQFVRYAHDRGIQVIMGFHWGWGRADLDISNREHCEMIRREVVDRYRRQYQPLGIDGIYFQTLTEHTETQIGGRSVAAVATDWVNHIAQGLFEIDPKLYIQFGLHATSIRGHYADLAGLDTRISIVWEDAGVLPYSYSPTDAHSGMESAPSAEWGTIETTLAYSRKLATFRPGAEFALVPKGWICLRWQDEFEHHDSFLIGRRRREWIEQRRRERQVRWDFVNTQWLLHYGQAARFYREILACKPARMLAAGLVEDGMFEHAIPPSVALFGQTIWNPNRPDAEILEQAMSPYYRDGQE